MKSKYLNQICYIKHHLYRIVNSGYIFILKITKIENKFRINFMDIKGEFGKFTVNSTWMYKYLEILTADHLHKDSLKAVFK